MDIATFIIVLLYIAFLFIVWKFLVMMFRLSLSTIWNHIALRGNTFWGYRMPIVFILLLWFSPGYSNEIPWLIWLLGVGHLHNETISTRVHHSRIWIRNFVDKVNWRAERGKIGGKNTRDLNHIFISMLFHLSSKVSAMGIVIATRHRMSR